MALKNKSLFLYGFQITANNCSLDFQIVGSGAQVSATLTLGYYSLNALCTEVARAMQAADLTNVYTCTADRTVSAGLQNRVSIGTSGAYLSLLFGSGTRVASSIAPLIGFIAADRTGATTYTGTSTAGTALVPNMSGYNYLPFITTNFGKTNVSSSGKKESIVFNLQTFWEVQFKYIPSGTWISQWIPLVQWMIQQRLLEFTPDVTNPTVFFEGTLENPNSGLSFRPTEQLSDGMPDVYMTPLMNFRQIN